MSQALTHLNARGEAHMVDVSGKEATVRQAVAEGFIRMSPEAREAVRAQAVKKGDVLAVARVAGIMAAKQVASLIPLCHPVPLSHVEVAFDDDDVGGGIRALATTRTTAQTGVEMEAMTAVSVGLLTIYDMVKSLDRGMTITGVRLLEKSGGRSGTWTAR